MAHYLVSILGEKLLRAPIDHPGTGELPSPNVRTRQRLRGMTVFVRVLRVVVQSQTRGTLERFIIKGLVSLCLRALSAALGPEQRPRLNPSLTHHIQCSVYPHKRPSFSCCTST